MLMTQAAPLLVAQVTDTHLFADDRQEMMGCRTACTLQAVLAQIEQLQPQPELLLLTGDLSQDETPASYQLLREQVTRLGIPAYWLPGNHDRFSLMQQHLSSPLVSAQTCFQRGGWKFLLLNSQMQGKVYGQLSPETLDWLEQQLQATDEPTLVALHHPPLPIGSAWMDAIGLQNGPALLQMIERYPQIKLVIFGHIHQAFEQERDRVGYLGSPSSCVQFVPRRAELAIDSQQPGFRLIWLYADGSYTTEVRRIGSGSQLQPDLGTASGQR